EILMSESHHGGQPAASLNPLKLCAHKTADVGEVWETLRQEAVAVRAAEPVLAHLVDDVILSRDSLAAALAARLARRLAREDMVRGRMEPMLAGVFDAQPLLVHSASRDLLAMFQRDPACLSPLEPLL